MLIKHIKLAIRFIIRDKLHSFLNIMGLTLGLVCSIIIFLYAKNELSFDRHHAKADRIYRIGTNVVTSGKDVKFALASPSFGYKLCQEYPGIETFVRFETLPRGLFRYEDKSFYEEGFAAVDTNIFEVFDYEFIMGDPNTCLSDPYSVVLTESLAKKYFGDDDPMGKVMDVEQSYPLKVTGVIKDPPANVHMPLKGLIPYSLVDEQIHSLDWILFEISGYTYLLFHEDFSMEQFWEKWPDFYEKYCAEDAVDYGQVLKPIMQKMPDIHYGEELRADYPVGNRGNLYIILSIGILVLILSCINYINMATARLGRRTKEIGMKKVLGASRRTLVQQFLTESFLLTFIALDIALLIVEFVLSKTNFNALLHVELKLGFTSDPMLWAFLILLFLVIGLLAGTYPAYYLSSVTPIKSLQGLFKKGRSGKIMRNILVTTQFVISITVIILTLFMNYQLDYMKGRNPGFEAENVVSTPVRDSIVTQNFDAIKAEFMQNPNIASVTASWSRPGSPSTGLYKIENEDGFEEQNFHVFFTSYNFLETLDIELLEGRDFSKDYGTDMDEAVVVNESLVRFMGWDDPIGMKINQSTYFKARVIGVVKDFNFQSLHSEIKPLIIRLQNEVGGRLLIKFNGDPNIVVPQIEEQWNRINPNRPFMCSFLQVEWFSLYEEDAEQNALIQIFSLICILISLIGLFGLTSFTVISRTKEVGIRKALGASTSQIVLKLLKEIAILVTLAFIIAAPLAYFIIQQWLLNFAFRADISPWLFIVVFLGAILIALGTALYHMVKVSVSNPVEALRYE